MIWERYALHLKTWAHAQGVRLPNVPSHCEQPYHIFYLIMPSLQERQAFIQHLGAFGILSVFHYVPLHLSEMGRKFGGKPGDCPVTEQMSERLVRLPLYHDLTENDLHRIIQAVTSFRIVCKN